MPTPLLLIDDEDALRGLLSRILSLEGYEVAEAGDVRSAMKQLERMEFPVVLCDVRLPDGNGIELTSAIKQKYPCTEVIVLTAFGRIEDGVQAIKNGAFDYLVKGNDNERILPLVDRALEKSRLQGRIRQLERAVGQRYTFDSILGKSQALLDSIKLARRVAPTDATVLLTGETGTGKEVFAQAIHHDSSHAHHAFVALNCSAFSKELLESELFGHRAGSFTGAVRDQKGLLEEATGGTLFLDEIGEMPIDLQAKLLRVLETGEFLRVGDTKPIRMNARIIAATNRDLQAESRAGRFREDLYYRLSVFEIRLAALRERKEDIAPLAAFFVSLFSQKLNRRQPPVMTPAFTRALEQYTWKGNVRELRNVIERAVILSEGELTADLLPVDLGTGGSADSPLDLASVEKRHILHVLALAKGNKAEAARLLQVSPATLYRKLHEFDQHQ